MKEPILPGRHAPPGRVAAWRFSGSRRVTDELERPFRSKPPSNGFPQPRVEVCTVHPDPGSNRRVVPTRVRQCIGVGRADRIDVDASDHVTSDSLENRVGEPTTGREVTGMHLEVAEVLAERHLLRPRPAVETGRGMDVVDR